MGQPIAIAAAVATGGESIKPEQHVAVDEQERRTHEALDGLDGSAKKRYRRGDAPPEMGFDALPTARRELDVSLPAGDAPTKLGHTQFVIIMLLLVYIAMSGAMG